MTSTPEPRHLNHHHRETVERIFQHPINHNLPWFEVESLLKSIGNLEARHDDRVHVTIGEVEQTIRIPRGKDLDEDTVMELRHLLVRAGFDAPVS